MSVYDTLSKLNGVKRSGQGWTAKCPAHEDQRNSLSISEGDDGRVLLYCHAGCSYDQIIAALGFTNGTSSRRIVAEYNYRDESGTLLYQAIRFDPKGFQQRRPDGQGGYIWKLNGTRRVLYCLLELLAADPQEIVYVPEGEKDVDESRRHGLVATCNVGGAGKWRDEYSEYLRGRHVVVLPDNDEPGRKHAAQVARSLSGIAASVRVLELPDLPPKGDVTDWLNAGGTVERLNELVEQTPVWSEPETPPLITSFAQLMSRDFADGEEIAFHACRGEIVLVQSVTNHGKTTLIRNASLALVTGGELLPVVKKAAPRKVLLLNLEGAGGRFQSDLRVMTRDFTSGEMGLVRENFFPTHAPVLDDEPLSLSRHMNMFEAEARAKGIDVIIIDTASAAFSIRNENDNAEVANYVMKRLLKLARSLNCLILLAHHIGKAKSEEGQTREQAHRGRGASAWADFSTSIFNLEADPGDQSRVTLTCGKRKDGERYERVLRLDRESRWLRATDEEPPKSVTNDDLVLEAMGAIGPREMQTAELEAALAGKVKRRTMMDCLNRLAGQGKVSTPRRGWWARAKVCASCAEPYMGLHNCTKEGEDDKSNVDSGLPYEGFMGGVYDEVRGWRADAIEYEEEVV